MVDREGAELASAGLADVKICCILNNKSGSGEGELKFDFKELFARHGAIIDIFTTREGQSLTDLAATAVDQRYDIIVAGGGDGTISAVASVLVGHPEIRMGLLPLGTLNHFSRDLKIPADISEAVEVICAGHSEPVDLGCVNDNYFLNNSSVGLYPAIVKLRESLQGGGYSKWWAAGLSAFRILSRFRRLDLEVDLPGQSVVRRKTALFFVGNNAYEMTPRGLGTRLALNRGTLWITMPTASSRTGLVVNLLKLVFKRERPFDTLIFEATSLTVMSRKRLLTIANDGEVLRVVPPLRYHILPKALNVIIPEPAHD